MTLHEAIETTLRGIREYPANYKITLRGIKAWRQINGASNLPTKKVGKDFNEFTGMVANMLEFNKVGREKTLEYVHTLDKLLGEKI